MQFVINTTLTNNRKKVYYGYCIEKIILEITNEKDDIRESELVIFDQQNIDNVNGDNLLEVLDDGSDFLVVGNDIEKINMYIDSKLMSKDENERDNIRMLH